MIIDSSVLIDIDRGSSKHEEIPRGRHSISAATLMELSTGANLGKGAQLGKLERNLDIIPIDKEVADKAGEITAQLKKEGEPVDLNDIYIAATGIIHGEPILTGNAKHFEKIDGAETVDWNQL